jgi:PAS domain S-box-containing protein
MFSFIIAFVGHLFYVSEANELRQTSNSQLKCIVDLKKEQVANWYKDQIEDVKGIAEFKMVQNLVNNYNINNRQIKENLSDILHQSKKINDLDECYIYSPLNELISSTQNSYTASDKETLELLENVNRTNSILSSDLFYSFSKKKIVIDFAAPIFYEKELIGIIVYRLDPETYLFPLIQKWPTNSNSAETLIIRKEGDKVLFLNELRHIKNSALKISITIDEDEVPAVKAVKGIYGINSGVDYRGVEVLSYVQKINDTPWFIIGKIDLHEIYSEIEYRLLVAVTVIIILIGLIISAAIWIYFLSQKNTYKKLWESEAEYKTTLNSIGDAVITADLKGCIKYMNEQAEKLTAWNFSEAKYLKVEQVFNIINEETRAVVESPVSIVLEKGIIVGLANHTLLIRKDGIELPIADSGAPIKNEKEEVIGVVLVFRDQSTERDFLNKLTENEEKYRYMFANSPQPMWIYDLETLKFLEVNNAATVHYGYTRDEFLSMNIKDIRPEEDIDILLEDIKHTYTIYSNSGLWRNIKKNGEMIIVEAISHQIIYNKRTARHVLINDVTERLNAEEKLRTGDKIFKHSLDMLTLAGFDGYLKEINPAWTTTLGWSKEELLSKPWKEFIHPDDVEKTSKVKSELVEGKQVYRFENRYLCKDGSYKWLSWNSIPYPDEQIMFGVARDITESKKNEDIIKSTNERLQKLLNIYQFHAESVQELLDFALNEAIELTNSKIGYIYFYNEEKKEFTLNSWSKEVMKECKVLNPQTIYQLEKTGIWGEAVRQRKEIIINDFPADNPFKKGTPDGHIELKKFLTIPLFDDDRIIAVTGVANKETEYDDIDLMQLQILMNSVWRIVKRREADYEILKLSYAVEQNPASIIITNSEGKIEYINKKFSELTGYTYNDVINKQPRMLQSGFTDPKLYEELWDTILSGKTWRGEFLNKKKNGDLFWEDSIISPIVNSSGDITHFVAIKQDITEKKQMLTELIKAKDNAEKANQLKSEFLAQISHEIRSPLNAVLSFSSLIKEETSNILDENLTTAFDSIESASKRIIRTIDMILNMSELQLGTYDLTATQLNLCDVIKKLTRDYTTLAKSKNLEISFNSKLEEDYLEIDDYAVTQIFANLIDNAIKYTKKGKIEIGIYKNESDKTCIDVSDTGIGISEEYLLNLFEPFSQEEHGYSRSFDGNGLGLALVKRYCSLINADISVKSKKNIGTTFTVTFNN